MTGRGGHTFTADEQMAGAILLRLAEMVAFDHGERVEVERDALPYGIATRRVDGMMPTDRRAFGFTDEHAPPERTEHGLTRRAGARALTPSDGEAGQPWRALLDRWNARPALAPVLGRYGVPSLTTDPQTGRVDRPLVLVAATSEDVRATAPVLLRIGGAQPPPDLTHLLPCDGDEFDRLAAELRRTAMARLAQ